MYRPTYISLFRTLTLLGDNLKFKVGATKDNENGTQPGDVSFPEIANGTAKAWLVKNKISLEQLQHFFHFEGGKAKPITLPGAAGAGKAPQTLNTYLILGLSSYLSTGVASFADKDARSLCDHFGCYDASNHTGTLKTLGNRVTGSKADGWTLTVPGLAAAAELVKLQPHAVAAS